MMPSVEASLDSAVPAGDSVGLCYHVPSCLARCICRITNMGLCIGLYRGYIGIMEKKVETTVGIRV